MGSPSGRVDIEGQAIDRLGSGNRLAFHIGGLDQSYLPELIDSLAAAEERCPVIGLHQL